MNIDYSGKTIIVTGAGGYIGSASAKLFASLGGQVVAADVDADNLNATVEAITSSGGTATAVQADLTVPEQVESIVDAAVAEYGTIDVLFNNAGGMFPTPMGDIDRESFEQIRSLNFDAVYHASLKALPIMVANGGGSIINTTSSAGTGAVFGLGVYGAAKAGVNSFTRSLAIEHGRSGIRANAIAPSAASPGMLAYLDTLPGGQEGFIAAQPMGRVGKADEIANVAAFLGSEFASFINGVTIPVDGGIEALLATPQ